MSWFWQRLVERVLGLSASLARFGSGEHPPVWLKLLVNWFRGQGWVEQVRGLSAFLTRWIKVRDWFAAIRGCRASAGCASACRLACSASPPPLCPTRPHPPCYACCLPPGSARVPRQGVRVCQLCRCGRGAQGDAGGGWAGHPPADRCVLGNQLPFHQLILCVLCVNIPAVLQAGRRCRHLTSLWPVP